MLKRSTLSGVLLDKFFSDRRDSLSHQDAAGGTIHHASSAKGSPRVSATDVKSSTCSPNADFGKPPTNNQVDLPFI